MLARDGDDYLLSASFQLPQADEQARRAADITVVIDCSGSMAGDSIEQVRRALGSILETLRPSDHFNLVRFGSRTDCLFRQQVPATETNLARARRLCDSLQADLGGTEIARGLRAAYTSAGPEGVDRTVLLLTDGEVGHWQPVVDEAERAGIRVFTIGIGSAPAESFIRTLADATGGHAELAGPREGMERVIVRQFERMLAPRVTLGDINWGAPLNRELVHNRNSVFTGDTVIAFAWLGEPPRDNKLSCAFNCEPEKSDVATIDVQPARDNHHASLLTKFAATECVRQSTDEAEAREVALRYGLVSEHTHLLLTLTNVQVDSDDLRVRKVPQMLAAGWGGVGSVAMADAFSDVLFGSAGDLGEPLRRLSPEGGDDMDDLESLEVAEPTEPAGSTWAQHFAATLDQLYGDSAKPEDRRLIEELHELAALRVPDALIEQLENVRAKLQVSESEVVAAFIHAFVTIKSTPPVEPEVVVFVNGQVTFDWRQQRAALVQRVTTILLADLPSSNERRKERLRRALRSRTGHRTNA